MRCWRLEILLPVLVAVALSGVTVAENPKYEPNPGWTAPADAAARPNPLAGKSEAVGGGKKIFQRECVECHGPDATGLEKKHSANLLHPAVQAESDGAIFWKITNGNPDRGMPSFSKLPELQRWQIILYLRTLKR